MLIVEQGHIYELRWIDCDEQPKNGENKLTFVNRESGSEHPGTQTQEVLRALIDRIFHCDNCLPSFHNDHIIYHLRMALAHHEARALVRKTEKGVMHPELIYASNSDGHFELAHKEPQVGAAPPRPIKHLSVIESNHKGE